MSEPWVVIDQQTDTPPFEQVRTGLAAKISTGQLVPGTHLPPVRTLAQDLGLAANTVARAYKELESAGLVETRGRAGTVVAATGDMLRARAQAAAAQFAQEIHALGLSTDEALQYAQAALLDVLPAKPTHR